MEIMKIILIIIAIIILTSIIRGGIEKFKANPIQSSLSSTQYIYEQGKEIVNTIANNPQSTDLGKPPCTTNQSCSSLSQCANNTCICQEGSCFT